MITLLHKRKRAVGASAPKLCFGVLYVEFDWGSHFGHDLDWGKGWWGGVLKKKVNKIKKWEFFVNKLKSWIHYVKTTESNVFIHYLQK